MPDAGRATTGSAITVGTFDGVHRGHRMLLARLVAHARANALRAVLVTFDRHPLEVLNPGTAPPLLTPGAEKLDALAGAGLDEVAVLPFTAELSRLDAEAFVDGILRERFGVRDLFVGHDHGFGRGRGGDAAMLTALGARRGFGVTVVPPIEAADGRPVSSSGIRSAIIAGKLAAAADGLGRRYAVAGVVGHGDARGSALGFRTLNLGEAPTGKLLPPDGVYAVSVETPTGRFGGMMNLGGRPTFGDARRTLEAHLFDAAGDWYGARVTVEFVRRVRDVRRFEGLDALAAQLRRDEATSRLLLARERAGL